jgi:hypothetical protein
MFLRTTNAKVSDDLLTAVFAAAFANGKHRGELKGIKFGLIAAGNMLVRIGLAYRDQKSAFGVRPNEDLHGIKQPKRRLTSRRVTVCYPRIRGVQFDHKAGGFVLDVLGVLGLVRYASNGDEVVTAELRKRIAVTGLKENNDNLVWL